MGHMFKTLKQIKRNTGSSRRGRSGKRFHCTFSIQLGRTQNGLNRTGFETPHNFKRGKGVHTKGLLDKDFDKQSQKLVILKMLAEKLIAKIDKEWAGPNEDWAVQFSKMNSADLDNPDADGAAVPWHTDDPNISHQYLFSLGDHEGGDIVTRRVEKAKPEPWQARDSEGGGGREELRFNYHNNLHHKAAAVPNILKMDGRFEHRLGRFVGTRYSVVYYKVYDQRMDRPDALLWPPQFVFR